MAKTLGVGVKDGNMVAVRFVEKEGKLVAHEIQHISKEVAKTKVGVVHKVEDGGKKVFVKTADGAEHVFHVNEHQLWPRVTRSQKLAKSPAIRSPRVKNDFPIH